MMNRHFPGSAFSLKAFAPCLALLLVLFAASGLAQAQTIGLTLGSASGAPSGTVDIPVTLATNGTSPSTLTMDITFDSSALTVSTVTAGAAATAASKDVSFNVPSAGLLKIVVAGINSSVMSDGALATIQFQIQAGATVGSSYALSGTATASDPTVPNPVEIPASITSGAVSVVAVAPTTGSLTVTVSPSTAVTAGAQWAVDGGTWRNSGATVSGLSVGNHTVTFKSVSGWTTPASQTVAITAGETATTSGTYTTSGTTPPPGGCGKAAKSLNSNIIESNLPLTDAKADVFINVESKIDNMPRILAEAASPVYRIGPSQTFAEPVAVLIPVPAGEDPDSLGIYYFSESPDHNSWYAAENVLGWIAPNSRTVVEEDGVTYIYFEVTHSGVLQLGRESGIQVAGITVGAMASQGRATW